MKIVAFFNFVKTTFTKHTSVDRKIALEEKNTLLKQILDNSVIADGVVNLHAHLGLDQPNLALLSDEFLEDIRHMRHRNLAVELLEKLLQDTIKTKARNNLVQEKRYSDHLEETLRRYHNRSIETAQVIEELIAHMKDLRAEVARGEQLGLSPDGIAFYDALAENESALREMSDPIFKAITVELTEKLRQSTTVDWQKRESVRAKLRILVRATLRKYKYPPDKSSRAIELILEQAETLSDSWTR